MNKTTNELAINDKATDLAFVREGVEPLEWSPVVRNICLLRKHLKFSEEDNLSTDFGDLDVYTREFDHEDCQEIARYLGHNMMRLLQLLPNGEESREALNSVYWFRACSDKEEIIKVELVPAETFGDTDQVEQTS